MKPQLCINLETRNVVDSIQDFEDLALALCRKAIIPAFR